MSENLLLLIFFNHFKMWNSFLAGYIKTGSGVDLVREPGVPGLEGAGSSLGGDPKRQEWRSIGSIHLVALWGTGGLCLRNAPWKHGRVGPWSTHYGHFPPTHSACGSIKLPALWQRLWGRKVQGGTSTPDGLLVASLGTFHQRGICHHSWPGGVWRGDWKVFAKMAITFISVIFYFCESLKGEIGEH